jgi:hypothetical protein
MFDVHMGAEGRARAISARGDTVHDSADGAETEMGVDSGEDDEDDATSSLSMGFSDDSDVTLVENENESEGQMNVVTETEDMEGKDDMDDVTFEEIDIDGICGEDNAKSSGRKGSLAAFEAISVYPDLPSFIAPCPAPLSQHKASATSNLQPLIQSPYSSPASKHAPGMIPNLPLWETNWYRRWGLLLELVKLDRDCERVKLESVSSSYASGRLYLADQGGTCGDVGGNEGGWGRWWGSSEENVTIVPRPLFMGASLGREVLV